MCRTLLIEDAFYTKTNRGPDDSPDLCLYDKMYDFLPNVEPGLVLRQLVLRNRDLLEDD